MEFVFHSWLIETILRNFEKIQRRVTDDVTAQKTKEEKDKEARRERIQKLKALQNGVEETVTQIYHEVSDGRNPFKPLQEIMVINKKNLLLKLRLCLIFFFTLRKNGIFQIFPGPLLKLVLPL